MNVNSEKFQQHAIFSELDNYMQFYDNLSLLVFPFITPGTGSMANIDSYVYSSIKGTIDSIQTITRRGRLNDAYALLRKYHDSVIINTYSCLYLEDNISIENFTVEKIRNWLDGKEQLPEYRIMSQYIHNSKKVASLNKLLYQSDVYKNVRERCNDHTHYNYFQNILLNDNEIYQKDRIGVLDQLSNDILNIFLLHQAYIIHLNQHYISSTEYRDNLESGMEPIEGTQYNVAPFVQEIFDKLFKIKKPDVANFLILTSDMHLN